METVVDLDIPPHESVLVLNGILDTDTNSQVVVSHSVGAFSNAIPSFINDADVVLYKDDEFVDSLFPHLLLLGSISSVLSLAQNGISCFCQKWLPFCSKVF